MSIVNPDAHFTLIDSNSKKMKVVQNIVDTLKLSNVKVVCSRAEDYHEKYDFILGRAVSAIPNFLNWSSHLLNETPQSKSVTTSSDHTISSGLLYLKGGDFTDELSEAKINPSSVQLFPVNELVQGLQSEKFVLYIPAHEISNFYNRKQLEAIKLKESKKKS